MEDKTSMEAICGDPEALEPKPTPGHLIMVDAMLEMITAKHTAFNLLDKFFTQADTITGIKEEIDRMQQLMADATELLKKEGHI